MENKSLIKLYETNFKRKSKYSINEFVELKNKDFYKIGSGYKVIKEEYKGIEDFKELNIPSFYKKREILTKDKNICLIAKNLELYILIQKYNLKKIDFDEFKDSIYNYFNIEKRKMMSNSKNTTFLVSNKQSIELPRDKALYPSLEGFRKELGLIILEIPNNFKRDETFEFLRDIRKFLNKIGVKKLKTNLRIRRILKYKKRGMFIVNGNTIVIDPRTSNSIIHEIGHYIYENGLAFNLNGVRIYKNRFENIIKKNRGIQKIDISKYEDYDKKSEIFAYWFEKN